MSKPEALATVTAALRNLLSDDMGGAAISTKPPSVARNGESGSQLNIFLYSVRYSPAFRNEPLPGKAKNGELAYPPMPLILKYLITAYGSDNDDISGQILLGKAMRILHDHPLLGQADLKDIVPESGLHEQAERIRITPDTLNLDDMSKLWSSFQSAEYRLSVGYEISVVLIESERKGKAAPPVLKRGEGDMGPEVLLDFPPSLSGAQFLHKKPAAELGEAVTLLGEHLIEGKLITRFHHPLFGTDEYRKLDLVRNENKMTVTLPEEDSTEETGWPAGMYTLFLSMQSPKIWASNQIAMPLAPTVLSVEPQEAEPDIAFVLTLTCKPQIRANQKAVLLFGDQMIGSDSITNPSDIKEPSSLTFTVKAPAKTQPYLVRLRVDGVDSIPVDYITVNPNNPNDKLPRFADNQKVTIS
jgi:hypothetical protein